MAKSWVECIMQGRQKLYLIHHANFKIELKHFWLGPRARWHLNLLWSITKYEFCCNWLQERPVNYLRSSSQLPSTEHCSLESSAGIGRSEPTSCAVVCSSQGINLKWPSSWPHHDCLSQTSVVSNQIMTLGDIAWTITISVLHPITNALFFYISF